MAKTEKKIIDMIIQRFRNLCGEMKPAEEKKIIHY
jgi:hypothetical protein